MRKVRTAGVAILVLALLGVASYRVWSSESQVRRRILAALRPYLSGPVLLRGASAELLRGIRIDELAIPARPRIRSETFADFFDIRLERGGGQREGQGWVASIRRGEISVEHGPDGRWNFDDLFEPGLPLSAEGGVRAVAFQEPVLLRIEAWDGVRSSREEVLRLSDLRITRSVGGALDLSAVARHPYFERAAVRADHRGARWRAEIDVDSLRASGEILARWLPAPLGDLPWQGIVDARFELDAGPSGPLSIRGEIVQYDGRLKLPPPLPAVEHLAGRIRVDSDGASLQRARGSLAGTDASLAGELWTREKGAEVRVVCASLPISSLGAWTSDPRICAWLARAAPLGSAQLALRLRDPLTAEATIEGKASASLGSAIGIESLECSVEIGGRTAVRLLSARILGMSIGRGDGWLELRDGEPTLIFPRIEIPGGGAEAALRLARDVSPPCLAGSLRAERLELGALTEALGIRAEETRGELSLAAQIREPNGLSIEGELSGGPIRVRGLAAWKGLPEEIVAILEEPLSLRLSFALGRDGFRGRELRMASATHLALARLEASEDGAWSAWLLLAKDGEPGGAPLPSEALRAWAAARAPLAFRGQGEGGTARWEAVGFETFWIGFEGRPQRGAEEAKTSSGIFAE